jgi:hypothetical protein
MKISSRAAIAIFLSCAATPAWAADDVVLQRLAVCQDSWLDWQKNGPAQLQTLGHHIGAGFTHRDNDPFAVPKVPTSMLGYPVSQVFPQSIGMAVGFSVTVDTPFDKARAAVEKAVGKKLAHCEASDDMKTCDLELAPQRTVTIMAEDSPKATQTLVGCYYFYEK